MKRVVIVPFLLAALLATNVEGVVKAGRTVRVSHSNPRGSAAQLYHRAFDDLKRSARFEVTNRTTFLEYRGVQPYTSDFRFAAPRRALSSQSLGGVLGTDWEAQVKDTYCSWVVDPSFRRIFCQHLRWGQSNVSSQLQSVVSGLGLTDTRLTWAGASGSIRRVLVRGRTLFPCPPGIDCPMQPHGTMTGVLSIDDRRVLPVAFQGMMGGDVPYARVAISYTYNPQLKVSLPTGPRTPCPRYAPPGGWCLQQP